MQGPGVDLGRSGVDLDFTCFSSTAARNRPPPIVKFSKSEGPLSFSSNDHYRFSMDQFVPENKA
jgi:hypothetical protein